MSIETTLSYINDISKQFKSQVQVDKNQSNKTSENFNDKLESYMNKNTPSVEVHSIDYEKIYKNLKELENIKQAISTDEKFYNDIKIGLITPFENYHNLSEEKQNKIKKTTVDIFGAEKGVVQLVTCSCLTQFYPPIIRIAVGEVMSYMTKDESIAFGNNFQKNINKAMKDENLLTTNEEGLVLLDFDEKGFLDFIYSIMKDNETNEKDKSLNNLYEKLLKETDRRYHPFETMKKEEALRQEQFSNEKKETPQVDENEPITIIKKESIFELLIKKNVKKDFNFYDYLKAIEELNKNSIKE
uniref:hypothetical protein n=1 Tax=Aliarcobacter sp. TaxID=2321116 RepID=UPI004048B7CF